jgi:hypothetical protein
MKILNASVLGKMLTHVELKAINESSAASLLKKIEEKKG